MTKETLEQANNLNDKIESFDYMLEGSSKTRLIVMLVEQGSNSRIIDAMYDVAKVEVEKIRAELIVELESL